MTLYMISDLHISGADDPLYFSLIALIKRSQSGDQVVLAGDIFDLFVGNKKVFRQRYSEFLDSVEKSSQRGVKLHYIEGNHDFHIREAFSKIDGIQIYPHHLTVDCSGKRFYIEHGDTVDRTDLGYRVLRALFRSPVVSAFITVTPGSWLDHIGKWASRKSRENKSTVVSDLPIVRREYLRHTYRSYAAEKLVQGFDFVVMGHCHDLDEMCFKIGNREGQYMNVGYPRFHGSFLSWSPNDPKIQRERLPEN